MEEHGSRRRTIMTIMRQAEDVHCYYKYGIFAVFGGIKP
jgi:hypothetical protein